MSGAILETYVLGELLKSWWNRGREPQLYYFRDKDGLEVDFLFARDQRIYPVEVKKTASPGSDDLRGFRALGKTGVEVGPGAVLCLCRDRVPLSREVQAVPIGIL